MRDYYIVTVTTPSGKKLTSNIMLLCDAEELAIELGTLGFVSIDWAGAL